MGCWYSREEREELVSRCRARKRYIKHFVAARQGLSAAHSMYLRSLRSTGSTLLQFANAESTRHLQAPLAQPHAQSYYAHAPTPPPPHPPPPMSPSTDTWTTTTATSITASPALPPPPPPPPAASGWDFWDPFMPSTSRAANEEEWEATATVSEVAVNANVAGPPSVISGFSKESGNSELAMVVSRNNGKDLVGIIKELDEYFLKAADAGGLVSSLLEISNPAFSAETKGGKVHNYGWSLSPSMWTWGCNSPKLNAFDKLGKQNGDNGGSIYGSHCLTAERLYAWEKKLYQEVKDAEAIKIQHEKKVEQLRKLELKRADYVRTEKTKKEVEKLESQLMVATKAVETASAEIIKLRDTELYPQLLELVKGLMCMWRSMYECHQVQTHIVQQLKYLNPIPSLEPTSEIHRQATLQLEHEVQQWHLSFCSLTKAQRDYIESLAGWLRLSLFQFSKNTLSRTNEESRIYSLCEAWQQAVDRIPEKVASEGINSLLSAIHGIVVQQADEQKQRKKAESAFRELDKRTTELRSYESKYGPYSMPDNGLGRSRDIVGDKRAKVTILRARAEEEKLKHEKSVSITRGMTLNNLQMSFSHIFQAIVGFSSVCMHSFESVYNQAKDADQGNNVKRLLP